MECNKTCPIAERGINIKDSIVILIKLFLYKVAISIVGYIILEILSVIGLNKESIEPYIKLLGDILAYVVFVKIYIKKNKHKLKIKNTLNFKAYSFVVLLLISYILIYDNTLQIFLSNIIKDSWIYEAFAEEMKVPIVALISISLVAPIFEEIVFRGIILDGLLIKYSPKKAIIISALIFGVIHGNFDQGVNAFLIGIILGIIYFKTKSLLPGILIHFLNNTFYFITEYYEGIYELKFSPIKLTVGLIILTVLGYIFITNNKNKSKNNYFINIE